MAAEIVEQPDVWRRLLREGRDQLATVAKQIAEFDPAIVLFVARGTSDHAALYGKYPTETVAQPPAGLVSPSTMTAYGARPDLDRVLMVGVSQSGGSSDLEIIPFQQLALHLAVARRCDPDAPRGLKKVTETL